MSLGHLLGSARRERTRVEMQGETEARVESLMYERDSLSKDRDNLTSQNEKLSDKYS